MAQQPAMNCMHTCSSIYTLSGSVAYEYRKPQSMTHQILRRQLDGPILPSQGCFLPVTSRASPGCRLRRGTADVTTVIMLSAHFAGRDAYKAPEGREQLSSFLGEPSP